MSEAVIDTTNREAGNRLSAQLDHAHSSVEFSVRHMGLATVRGRFEKFSVEAEALADGIPTSVTAVIDAASITTGAEKRDEHLRSADFFDVATYPEIRFESTNIKPSGSGHLIEGNLTMRGVTRPVSFETDFSGLVTDPWGNPRAAAEASGKINRTDFGLTWNQVLEAGALLVGEEVRFNIAVQMVAQAEAAA